MSRLQTNLGFLWKLLLSRAHRRYALRWWRTCWSGYLLENRLPWLVIGAIDAVAALDLAGRQVFEYGSGGSTLFWQAKGASTVSIEHDPAWFEIVRSRLAAAPKVDYRLIEPQPTKAAQSLDPSDPEAYRSADARWREASFCRYATAIEDYQDETFDIVLVDGRARPSCIKHGASKVAAGGALILDDSERPYYLARTREHLREFDERRFFGPRATVPFLSATSIFTKQR